MRTWFIVIACFAAGFWLVSRLMAANDTRPFRDAMRGPQDEDSPSSAPPGPDDRVTLENWHIVLGVARNADKDAVRAAYKLQMSRYHPDKVQQLGEEIRAVANRKARQINAAYDLAVRYGRA